MRQMNLFSSRNAKPGGLSCPACSGRLRARRGWQGVDLVCGVCGRHYPLNEFAATLNDEASEELERELGNMPVNRL